MPATIFPVRLSTMNAFARGALRLADWMMLCKNCTMHEKISKKLFTYSKKCDILIGNFGQKGICLNAYHRMSYTLCFECQGKRASDKTKTYNSYSHNFTILRTLSNRLCGAHRLKRIYLSPSLPNIPPGVRKTPFS